MVAGVTNPVDGNARRSALEAAGLLHPRPEAVTATLFDGQRPFFFALDKVQVKYEMLRAHIVDRTTVSAAAETHGYSRAAFYLVADSFAERGMRGLFDEPRGRRGPWKLTAELLQHLHEADSGRSGADLAEEIERVFGVHLHRRTVERARRQ